MVFWTQDIWDVLQAIKHKNADRESKEEPGAGAGVPKACSHQECGASFPISSCPCTASQCHPVHLDCHGASRARQQFGYRDIVAYLGEELKK